MRVRAFLVVVAAAGLVLLVACGGGGEQSTSTATPSASAEDGGELTREQAIQRVLEMLEAAPDQHADPSTATARRLTECEALDIMRWQGVPWGASPTPASESPVWLVEVGGEFSGFIGYGITPDPSPPRAGRFVQIIQLDDSVGGAGAILPDERAQEGPELSRERILERALDEVAPPGSENEPDPSTAVLTQMTYREAVDTLRREGGPDFSERPRQDDPAWLFEVGGKFVGFCPGPMQSGRYFLVLALDGFVESSGFIPDAAPTP
jgi:hypothetical protein